MKAKLLAVLAAGAVLSAAPALAQGAPKISDGAGRLGLILDMSGVYADVTGEGSATAARMAVEDFGGKVLGAPIEVMVADHLNKADVAGSTARQWFDKAGVDALMDVAATPTAIAAVEVAREKKKIVLLSGPGATQLTGEHCMPYSAQWVYDTYAVATTTAAATTKTGGNSWFFITADYAFGHELERDASAAVKAAGGSVLGSVRAPLATPDFSSLLLQAQASKAKIVALANAGNDLRNAAKQAAEFGLTSSGQSLAGLLMYIQDAHALGTKALQGTMLTSAFYWDMNDETRAFSKRFYDKLHKMPNMSQAGVYSATTHYLKAVQKAGTDETEAVMKAMRETPVNDFFAKGAHIREDGLLIHNMYLFRVKKPDQSKGEWDLYELVATVPGDQAFPPLSASRCPLVKKG